MFLILTKNQPQTFERKSSLINAKYSLLDRKCLEKKKLIFVHHKWRWNQWIGNDNNFNGKTDDSEYEL